MTPDERGLLQGFLQDLVQTRGPWPRMRRPDSMIRDALRASPDAPYVLVQHAILSDQALHAAQEQIATLQGTTGQHRLRPAPHGFWGSQSHRFQAAAPQTQAQPHSQCGSPSRSLRVELFRPWTLRQRRGAWAAFCATREPRPPAWLAGRCCSKAFQASFGGHGGRYWRHMEAALAASTATEVVNN